MSIKAAPVHRRLASLPSALILVGAGVVLGLTSCAQSAGLGAQVAAPTSDDAGGPQPAKMVPASGLDTGRTAPPEGGETASPQTAAAEPEPALSSAETEESSDTVDERSDALPEPGDGARDDLPVEGSVAAPRSPLAALIAPSVAFMVNYQSSGASTLAQGVCDAKAKGDMEKRAECLQDARKGFKADVLVFTPLNRDRYTLTVYSRSGSTLKEVFASTVELKDASQENVTMRFLGGQRGVRPIFGGKAKVTLTLATDSSLVIEDPRFGTLPYSAKVGLVQGR